MTKSQSLTILTIFAISTSALANIASSPNFGKVEFRKCRYCAEGLTQDMLMFMKYDLPRYNKAQLKLKFQIEDGQKPQMAVVDKEGNDLETHDITGFTLAKFRALLEQIGLEPIKALISVEEATDDWKKLHAHLEETDL